MITVYATNKYGNGNVMKIAELESLEDYEVQIGMFADDVVISFVYTERS